MNRLGNLSFLCVALFGCGGGSSQAQVVPAPVLETTSQIVDAVIIGQGNQPLTGNVGPKSYTWFSDRFEFEAKWLELFSEPLPDVDFSTNNVVLFDFGGERNADTCREQYSLDDVSAELITATVTSDNAPGAVSTTTLIVDLTTMHCISNRICQDILVPERPFSFISVPKVEEVIIREEVTLDVCP